MGIEHSAATAKQAAINLAAVSTDVKNRALSAIADSLEANADAIVAANEADIRGAEKEQLAPPLLKRLGFDRDKIDEAVDGLKSLISLEDPVGRTLDAVELDTGLELYKVSCPIGVIGVIFESRPDALVQISCLCLKSGNGVLLKGGSEAAATNRILAEIITQATVAAGIPPGWLGLLETRADVADMLALDESIDLIIPRGSNAFVKHIMDNTHIPVLGHADGICHLYIDKAADLEMAVAVSVDSKVQYVAVCNAAESLLVHEQVAPAVLPALKKALEAKGVEIRGCGATRRIIDVIAAQEADWRTEYLDLVLSVKVVPDMAAALNHINGYGSGHTDVIVTGDRGRAIQFMNLANTANAFWNCSSRFSDGFRYGLGAEVGISTNKIHARGPVGLEGLVIYQWRMMGSGQVVADYCGPNAKTYTHRKLQKRFKG
ncbi:MAG: glutamate-5-semialdehyde dehydrogenase [Desulfobacteraceae bacterium]|jgi:glutamate-5-semialdehyde dehydrogenase